MRHNSRIAIVAALVSLAGLLPPVLSQSSKAFATGPFFVYSRSQAISFANAYEFGTWHYRYNNDCTNFASDVMFHGNAPLDANGGNQWYYQWASNVYFSTPAWREVSDFRDYWYQNQSRINYIFDYNVTSDFNTAYEGDPIVYSRGDNGYNSPDFSHIGIEHHWSSNGDYEIQHTIDEIVPWNTFYYHSTADEQKYQRYWGYRIIDPLYTN